MAARSWRPWVAVGLLAIIGVYLARCWLFSDQVNDDAFITFRYSRFLATGRGPYFNVGEHVEGYTNFLLMIAMVPVYWLGGEAALLPAAKLIGVACGVGCLLLVFRLGRDLVADDPVLGSRAALVGLGAAALVAAAPAFAVNSTTGLETTLFAFLVILGIWLATRAEARQRWCGAGIAWAAAGLTRPEAPYLFGFAMLGVLVAALRTRTASRPLRSEPGLRRATLDASIVVAVAGLHTAFRLAVYDGEWLPNTFYAKAGGFWKVDAWSYIRPGLIEPFLGVVGVALALPGIALLIARTPRALVLVAVAVAGATLPFVTGPGWMIGWRLSMPFLPLLACVVAIGWALGVAAVAPRWAGAAPLLVLLAAGASGALQWPLQADFEEAVSVRAKGYDSGHRALAEWLCGERALPGDRIALMDIGIVGYYCDAHPILDISGLTDRFIAKSDGEFLRKKYDPAYVLDARPRYVVLTSTADGWYYQPPPPKLKFNFWTRMERRLYGNPEFKARYVRREAIDPESDDWLENLRRGLGAVKVFEHAYPGKYYLLFIFEADSEAGS